MPTTPVGGLFSCVNPVYAVYPVLDTDGVTVLSEEFVAVEAWDSSGDAWIVGTGGLVLAKSQPRFARLFAATQVRTRDIRYHIPADPGRP